MLGPADGPVVAGALASARRHGLPHEELSASDVVRRFPGIRPTTEMVGLWEPRAGFVIPELAIASHLALAAEHGAELHLDEPVVGWEASTGQVQVTTARGTATARRLVLAAGAWMRELLPELALPLTVERMVLYWFRPPRATDLFTAQRFPIFICEYTPGRVWYGLPDVGDGVKVALHHDGEPTDPDTVRRDVRPDEVTYIRALLRTFLPAADGELVDTAVCLYTNTPDECFLIDTHPAHSEVVIASPCSGHGFKFSSAIGELLADLALAGTTSFDLTPFRLARLPNTAT
jgi:sarcosine oxidase